VPPYLLGAISSRLPLPPVYPRLKLESPAGGSEEAPALPESPEYIEYRRKQREWNQLRADKLGDFTLDYCVVAWRFNDDEEWQTEPPEGWEIDPILKSWGLANLGENRRVAFIKQELVLTDGDLEMLDRVADEKSLLTKEEVLQAMVPFDSSDEDAQSTGQQEVAAE